MKLRIVFLLVLTCVMSVIVTRLVSRPPSSQSLESRSENEIQTRTIEIPKPVARDVVITNTIDWLKVESADYVTYVQNLRAIGCPRETLADIIVADVNKLFTARAKQFLQGTNALPKFEYWKVAKEQRARAAKKGELKKQLVALDAERVALIKKLLQNDVSSEQLATPWSPVDLDDDRQTLAFLSQEKQSAMKQIEADMDAETRKRIKPGSQDLAGLRELELLRQERESKIKQVLTPEEKLEFDLRSSAASSRLRTEMDGFTASETEFRQILPLRKGFEDEFSPLIPPTTVEEIKARVDAQAALSSKLRLLLGDDRSTEYERAIDPNYKFLRSTFQSSEIPNEQLTGVYNAWSAAQSEADRVRYDTSLSMEERSARLKEISSAAQTQIQMKLGNGPGSEVLAQQGSLIFGRLENLNPPRRSSGTSYFPK